MFVGQRREADGDFDQATILSPADRFELLDGLTLADAIERLYLAWKEHGRAPSRRPEWIASYTRARLAGRLAAELDSLCAGHAVARGRP